ncbi:MAG: Mov34/MPN/PAD-1 family protein [Myxococcales bacterium]|nr:Mov34/MPN/PAD-1 family protein [Myxococcales bacterium]
MLETAALIGAAGDVLHWHAPAGRTVVSLPDSRALWETMWELRDQLVGVAHTHPGVGAPAPSGTDLTTFDACELGLGVRLRWWIATGDQLRCFVWRGPYSLDYERVPLLVEQPPWLDELRARSGFTPDGPGVAKSITENLTP